MPTLKDKRKLKPHGRKVRFAEFSGVKPNTVSMWLGGAPSSRLDRLIKTWKPRGAV